MIAKLKTWTVLSYVPIDRTTILLASYYKEVGVSSFTLQSLNIIATVFEFFRFYDFASKYVVWVIL